MTTRRGFLGVLSALVFGSKVVGAAVDDDYGEYENENDWSAADGGVGAGPEVDYIPVPSPSEYSEMRRRALQKVRVAYRRGERDFACFGGGKVREVIVPVDFGYGRGFEEMTFSMNEITAP